MSSLLANFLHQERYKAATIVMDIPKVRQSVDELICLLFPQRGCHRTQKIETIETQLEELKVKFLLFIKSVSVLDSTLSSTAEKKVNDFFSKLPDLALLLDSDVEAAFSGDPAAYSKEEVIITYPGFYAVCIYRIAHALFELNIPLLPRLISEYAHEKTGIDIHPGASIGPNFFIDHGTGVVIGETTRIGKNVKIYQGVTLGALSVKKKMQSIKRHPTIEDDVVIYANTTILGGETIIGRGSIIGGNVWLTDSTDPGSLVFNKLEIQHFAGKSDGNSPI
jgi:serine O-acetyltransferase